MGGKGEILYGPSHILYDSPGMGNPAWKDRFQEEFGYNPKKARELLAQAGWSKMETNIFLYRRGNYPPALDVGEAIGGYFKAVGVDAKLHTIPTPERIKNMRALKWDNHMSVCTSSSTPLRVIRVYNSGTEARGHGAELPALDELYLKAQKIMDPDERNAVLRKWGDLAYEQHMTIPLFAVSIEMVGDPNIIESYTFPGTDSGIWTHFDALKAVHK
jgi:ABC-type transport system substrate-binding protein